MSYTPPEPGHIRCRTLLHAWDTMTPDRVPRFGVLMALRCVSCGTIRYDTVAPGTGDLLYRRYVYPSGYREVPKQTRAEWRVTFIALPTTEKVTAEPIQEASSRKSAS